MSRSLGERLKAHWLAQGLSPRPAVAPDVLTAFEARHQLRLPDDLRECLLIVNGTGQYGEWDESGHCWWSLEEMTTVSEQWPDEAFLADPGTWLLFADLLIWCPVYAVRLSHTGNGNEILAIYSDGGRFESHSVATSFTEVAERYLKEGTLL